MSCRSDRLAWWRLPPNRVSWLAVVALVGLQWMTVSVPPVTRLLGIVPLDGGDWLAVLVAVLWPVVALEVAKIWRK